MSPAEFLIGSSCNAHPPPFLFLGSPSFHFPGQCFVSFLTLHRKSRNKTNGPCFQDKAPFIQLLPITSIVTTWPQLPDRKSVV